MVRQAIRKSRIIARGRVAFTLVELLTVAVIISIMVGLLLPAVQAAREAARRGACADHIKQLAMAALQHESAQKFLPTGGWYITWLGNPDCGFGTGQPGGWIYNILPYLDQQNLHDLGASGGGMTIQAANAQRLATPLSCLNCPTRRPAALYPVTAAAQFKVGNFCGFLPANPRRRPEATMP